MTRRAGHVLEGPGEVGARERVVQVEIKSERTRVLQEAHDDVVGEALLKTLESALGDEWTPAVREAWTQTYGVVKTTMIRGATEFERKNLDA